MQSIFWWFKFSFFALAYLGAITVYWGIYPLRLVQLYFGRVADCAVELMLDMHNNRNTRSKL